MFWALLGMGRADWAIWFGSMLSVADNVRRALRRRFGWGGLLLFAMLAVAEQFHCHGRRRLR